MAARPIHYLLDTCFLSDLAKPAVPAGIKFWSSTHDAAECAVSVLTIGELRHGIELLPDGRRRSAMHEWLSGDVVERFAKRTLDVTLEVAETWGILAARARRSRRNLPAPDGLILATAVVHRLTVVTRNVRDFSGYDVPIVNPWEATEE